MDAVEFLGIIRQAVPSPESPSALATVDAGYAGGRPQLVFDGEDAASGRTYAYVSSYTPAAGDRVLLLRSGRTWVVIGKVV